MKIMRYILLLASSLLLACTEEAPEMESLTIRVDPLASSTRSVVTGNLVPTLILLDTVSFGSREYVGVESDSGLFDFDIGTPTLNTTYEYTLNWAETYRGRELMLATGSGTFSYSENNTSILISSTSYSTAQFDDDNDGVSNFEERGRLSSSFTSNPYLPSEVDGDTDVRVVIPRTTNRPVIDGVYYESEWQSAVDVDNSNNTLYINNLILVEGGADQDDGTAIHRWEAVHDGTYMYLLVLVDDTDDVSDSDHPRDDDTLNFYLDADWSHQDGYDGVNDWLFMIPRSKKYSLSANSGSGNDGTLYLDKGSNSADLPLGFDVATSRNNGPFGRFGERMDVYEIRFRLSSIEVQVGKKFGIDVHLDDDDNGGERDSKWSWFRSGSDDSWRRTDRFAGAVLEY